MDRDELLRLLMVSAHETWIATLVGNRAPSTDALYRVLENPQPGDLVLEITSRKEDPSRFGRLLRVVKEPMHGEWDEEIDGPRPSDTYWYIEDVDGNEQCWFNCKFIRVLERRVDPMFEAQDRGLVNPAWAHLIGKRFGREQE